MKKIELKCFLFFLLLALIVPSVYTRAEDIAAQFMDICIRNKNPRSFCECALKAYSKDTRERRKAELKRIIEKTEKRKEMVLADPAMSEERLNAVLKIQNSAIEYDKLAIQANQSGDRDKSKELKAKQKDLQKQKVELVESYGNISGQVKMQLINSHFCNSLCSLDRTKKELAQVDETLFPGAEREIKNFNQYHSIYKGILSLGYKAACPRPE